MDSSEILRLTDIRDTDRDETLALLDRDAGEQVLDAMAVLRGRLGAFPGGYAPSGSLDEFVWLEAYLRFTPELLAYWDGLGIPAEISAATLADLGRNVDITRRVLGRFGLETFGWLSLHYAGNLFQLGRLQFHLLPHHEDEGWAAPDEWILSVHIPEGGGLSPAAVDASFEEAVAFFGRHFPGKPVRSAECISWLLDPELSRRLPESNMARFARRFTLERTSSSPTDAVYFTFRKRGLDGLELLPRDSSLQRAVLEHLDDGGEWGLGHGHLTLPVL
ncbi:MULTISPECIES: acyltransferase domain-containing protein [Arthrobacter]|uniref:Acyltransferase domain-containing protein n=2 Tax=Arthrobacter TaxID=1663 RepID=A0ABU9KFQ0_9MICC|nr:acyltransferase domain-containing protein [Arthrobacter sp. YJM1]MDP5225627.1 acyltransferase domain-containing protein [Arthrobacter sp. YJM1]